MKKNIYEPALAIQYFYRLIAIYHKNNPEKLITTYFSINMTPLIARSLVKPTTTKQNHGQFAKAFNKYIKT